MNTYASVEEMVLGKSLILPSTSIQPTPPSTPMIVAKTSAASTLPTSLPGSMPPCVYTCNSANTPTMHSTSVNADSSTSTVAGFSERRNASTIGITTAEDVPPSVTPSNMAGIQGKSRAANPNSVMITAVSAKHTRLSTPVVASDLPSTPRFSEVPLSNRTTTRAIVATTEPTLPKSCGATMPRTGPSRMPASISTNTSGMLVLRNCKDRKCAKKTISPMARIVMDIHKLLRSEERRVGKEC